MRESEFRARLEDLHRRLDRLLRELDDVRAEIAEAAIDLDNRVVFTHLHADDARKERPAA